MSDLNVRTNSTIRCEQCGVSNTKADKPQCFNCGSDL